MKECWKDGTMAGKAVERILFEIVDMYSKYDSHTYTTCFVI